MVSGKDGKAGRLSSRMAGRLEGAEARLAATRVEKRYDADVWLDAKPSKRKVLLRTGPCSLPLGDAPLSVPALHIGNKDHVGLIGDNGSGKTTLVRRIVGSLPDATRLLYIPQEPDESQRKEVLQTMRKLMLALGTLGSPELVIMDEPTNHLDLGSTEALKRLLSAYPGALLLVSHDAALLGSATGATWRIKTSKDGYELVVG